MRRYLVLMLLLCLVVCGHTRGYMHTAINGMPLHQCFFPIPVGISANVPVADRVIIVDGLKYWNNVRPGLFFLMDIVPWASDDPQGFAIVTIGRPDNWAAAEMPGERKAATTSYEALEQDGCMKLTHVNLLYPLAKDPEVGKVIIRHELGHVLGLDHNSEPGSLMNAKQHTKHLVCCLSPTELETLKELYP